MNRLFLAFAAAAISLSACSQTPDNDEAGNDDGDTSDTQQEETETTQEETDSTQDETGSTDDGDTDVPGSDCAQGTLLVTGTVERENTSQSWNEPFVPSPDAHVLIRLFEYNIDGGGDVLLEQELPFEALPFDYELCGASELLDFDMNGVSVQIFNHPGTDRQIGDLISETIFDVGVQMDPVDVLVRGQESCASPEADVFCADE